VLGVPGWWPANELAGFYEDATVFRPQPSMADATGDAAPARLTAHTAHMAHTARQ
jgi:hypothetical protein